jgi:haloacid dehalogenase-like hydrolase
VPNAVRLVVADVDGTLVTPDKILTPRVRAVVRTIIEAGIAFTITSGRPPLGMKMLIDDLDLREPVIGFNGGLVVCSRQHLRSRGWVKEGERAAPCARWRRRPKHLSGGWREIDRGNVDLVGRSGGRRTTHEYAAGAHSLESFALEVAHYG